MIQKAFPDKKIVIAEAGWPSEGRVKKGSVPSASMEAFFIRKFLTLAASNNYDYYIIEAYDQPWKAKPEGAVGAFWGLFDADRAPKFAFTGKLSSFPQWPTFAIVGGVGHSGSGRVGAGIDAGGHAGRLPAAGRHRRLRRVRGHVHHRRAVAALRRLGHRRRRDVDDAGGTVHRAGVAHRNRGVGAELCGACVASRCRRSTSAVRRACRSTFRPTTNRRRW